MRQQPIPHSRSLAYNSAVAMRVGSAIFETELTNGLSLNVYVNHHTTHSKSGKLAGGGSFKIDRAAPCGEVGTSPRSPSAGRTAPP